MSVKDKPVRPVTMRGKYVYLRPLCKDTDLDRCLTWINDPDVTQFLSANPPVTKDEEEKWFDSLADRTHDKVFAIVLQDDDRYIGNIGLHHIDHLHGSSETGTFIGEKELWGKGYGTDAKMILLDYAFNALNLRRVTSKVFDFNGRSVAYANKCGYVEEGRMRQEVYKCGAYRDLIIMGVLKEEWLPLWESYNAHKSHIPDCHCGRSEAI